MVQGMKIEGDEGQNAGPSSPSAASSVEFGERKTHSFLIASRAIYTHARLDEREFHQLRPNIGTF